MARSRCFGLGPVWTIYWPPPKKWKMKSVLPSSKKCSSGRFRIQSMKIRLIDGKLWVR